MSHTRRPVVVVGDVGIDVLARPRMPVVPGGEVTADIVLAPGGAGGNTAAWLATFHVDVALVGRVGDDEAARATRAALESAGVHCVFAVDASLPTCVVVVLVGAGGERTMLSDRGANAALRADDVALDAAAEAAAAGAAAAGGAGEVAAGEAAGAGAAGGVDPAAGGPHLHVSGYVLLGERSRAAGLAALAGARERGWTTSVDPQSAELITAAGAETFLGWVQSVDLLLPNEVEAEALGGPQAILAVVDQVAVTHGGHGARWFSASGDVRVPAPNVECLDSTGAGDAFNAGLLASWLRDPDPRRALAAGVEAGSAAAAGLGARPRPATSR